MMMLSVDRAELLLFSIAYHARYLRRGRIRVKIHTGSQALPSARLSVSWSGCVSVIA